jgi:hypothetical protein
LRAFESRGRNSGASWVTMPPKPTLAKLLSETIYGQTETHKDYILVHRYFSFDH